jgi:cathepsin E
LRNTAGIVDTGTTLILLETAAYTKYVAATKAVPDPRSGLLRLTEEQYVRLQSLYFHIGGVSPNVLFSYKIVV